MKKTIVIPILVMSALIFIFSCKQNPASVKTGAIDKDSLIKRGEYLVMVAGCHDCHSPKKMTDHGPVPDPDLLLSGHPEQMPVSAFDTVTAKNWALFNVHNTAIVGPWGISFSANLTSDATGIGNWKEEQFIKALREGKFKGLDGNRMLLPPMPWPTIGKMTDEDLKAIFAYLQSTKPIKNIVPAPIPPTELGKYISKG